MNGRLVRILAATGSLALSGAVLGSVVGAASLLILGLPAIARWNSGTLFFAVLMGTMFGAPLGCVAAPLLGWTLLRNIAIGRGLVICSIGALVGGFAGIFLGSLLDDVADGMGIFYLIGGAIVGVVWTAGMLWAGEKPSVRKTQVQLPG